MKGSPSRAKRFVLMCWILVGIFYVYLSSDYIRISMKDGKFNEALQHIVQLAGTENRNSKDVRALVLVRADELEIPIRGDQITILGGGHSLTVAVGYDMEVDIPIFMRGFYTKHYEHKVIYRESH